MEVKQYIWDVVDSNSWLILEDDNGLLIDVVDNQELFEAAKALKSLTVILTHSHFDHIIGLNTVRNICGSVEIISTSKCSENIGNIYRNMSATAKAFVELNKNRQNRKEINPFICKPADKVFEDEVKLNWFEHKVNLLAVHGHTCDGLVLSIDNKLLFSGDTLLNIPTVTRFPTGSTKRFWNEDIPILQELGIEAVYPGHGKAGKMNEMIKVNIRSKSIKNRE